MRLPASLRKTIPETLYPYLQVTPLVFNTIFKRKVEHLAFVSLNLKSGSKQHPRLRLYLVIESNGNAGGTTEKQGLGCKAVESTSDASHFLRGSSANKQNYQSTPLLQERPLCWGVFLHSLLPETSPGTPPFRAFDLGLGCEFRHSSRGHSMVKNL